MATQSGQSTVKVSPTEKLVAQGGVCFGIVGLVLGLLAVGSSWMSDNPGTGRHRLLIALLLPVISLALSVLAAAIGIRRRTLREFLATALCGHVLNGGITLFLVWGLRSYR